MTLPELRLPCREKQCVKCCIATQMPLSERDIERLERLGYRREEFATRVEGEWRLRNINGRCYFLDPERGCRVYQQRPLGCRLYPAVCVEGEGIAVDAYCPLYLTALKILADNEELVKRIARAISEEFGVECPPRLLGLVYTGDDAGE